MDVIKKLSELANQLDAKGFYAEADEIDSIIKEALSEPKSVHNFPEDVIEVQRPRSQHSFPPDTIRARPGSLVRQVNQLRREVGLPPGPFDRQLAQRLNKYFPGVWRPGAKQKAVDLLAAVRQQKQQRQAPDTGVAMEQQKQQAPTGTPQPRGMETPAPASPSMKDLFPQRSLPPDVSLGPKKEYPVEIPGQSQPGLTNEQLNERLKQQPKSLFQLQHERRMQQGK